MASYCLKRLAAFFIDLPVLLLAGFVCRTVLPQFEGLEFLAGWLYFAAMESSALQATPGKKLLGLQVADPQGNRIGFWRASVRYWAKLVSFISLGAGLVLIFFTDKRQAFHDYAAGCVVRSTGDSHAAG